VWAVLVAMLTLLVEGAIGQWNAKLRCHVQANYDRGRECAWWWWQHKRRTNLNPLDTFWGGILGTFSVFVVHSLILIMYSPQHVTTMPFTQSRNLDKGSLISFEHLVCRASSLERPWGYLSYGTCLSLNQPAWTLPMWTPCRLDTLG
jgi:hypothetical protein